jgi:lysophospholipase L1-like esterase
MKIRRLAHKIILMVCILGFALVATTQDLAGQERWVATWAASPQPASFDFPGPKQPAGPELERNESLKNQDDQPEQSDQPPPFFMPPNINNQTVRMIVRASIGGSSLRVHISNAYGTSPLTVGAAHIALHDKGSAIIPASDRALTFSRKDSFVIPPGALIVSDPVDLQIPELSYLTISVYVAGTPASPTIHLTGLHTTHISKPGDYTRSVNIEESSTVQSWYWISGVDVLAPSDSGLIVALGDSITDGATSTPDTDRSWPSILAERLLANKETADLAIVNQGISGNRLLGDGAGVSALARFDRDVISQAGVKWLIVLEGINDIGMSSMGMQMGTPVTAEDLIAAHWQMIERAHLHGIKAIGATLTPFAGALYYSEKGESMRQAVNHWIRTSGAYDAVIDFDAILRDPENPKQMNAGYFINDYLHPNDAGYKAMAEAVDMSIFTSDAVP